MDGYQTLESSDWLVVLMKDDVWIFFEKIRPSLQNGHIYTTEKRMTEVCPLNLSIFAINQPIRRAGDNIDGGLFGLILTRLQLLLFYMSKVVRVDSLQGEPFRFIRIKDLHFFRHLLRNYDLSLVKDYLTAALSAIPIEPHVPYCLCPRYFYVPSQDAPITVTNADGEQETMVLRAGRPIPDWVCDFEKGEQASGEELTLYVIARRTVLILQQLYFLELPVMANMKSAEKLAFLDKCEVQALAFNSFAYRRGEDVDALYYLLEGQVKMLKELGENVYEVASLERGRMFGLFELRSRISQRELYAKASANSTNVLQIPLKLIEKVCSDRQTTIEALLTQEKSQLFSMLPKSILTERHSAVGAQVGTMNNCDSSRVMLERRLKTFESTRMIKSSVLQGLVYSKKMLYRVKELNQRIQNYTPKANKLHPTDPHAVRHFNDKWRGQLKQSRARQTHSHSRENLPFQPKQTHNLRDSAIKGSIKRLIKYPAVQRYLSMEASIDPKTPVPSQLPS